MGDLIFESLEGQLLAEVVMVANQVGIEISPLLKEAGRVFERS
jgi:hypothetical protein